MRDVNNVSKKSCFYLKALQEKPKGSLTPNLMLLKKLEEKFQYTEKTRSMKFIETFKIWGIQAFMEESSAKYTELFEVK